jgi:hypothetical protein
MYSQTIITAPIALFLGAGASRPFGKMLMGEFIDHLKNLHEFKNDALFNDIASAPGGRDLEYLFEELDEWSRKGYHPVLEAVLIGGQGGMPPTLAHAPGLPEKASKMLADLRKQVFNEYRDIDPGQAKDLVQRFDALLGAAFKGVDPGKNPIVIFTTNYDPAVETFCTDPGKHGEYRLCDGFVPQPNSGSPVWRRESIDQLQLGATGQKDLVLFKLHGSTTWFRTAAGIIKSDAPIYTGDDLAVQNMLIYPAKRKIALDDPYFTAYDYLQRTLENCKLCVVIGYSFRDYDALSRLRSAASYNSSLTLLVVDPQANALCKELGRRGVTAEPIPTQFGSALSERDYLAAIEKAQTAAYAQRQTFSRSAPTSAASR